MDVKLQANSRSKNENLKKMRKNGFIPAHLYGQSISPSCISLSEKDLQKCLQTGAKKVDISWNGKRYHAAIEEIQKDCISNKLCHIAFHVFEGKEKIYLDVPIHFVGKPAHGVVKPQLQSISVYGEANSLPEMIEVDISSMKLGDSLHVGDIKTKGKYELRESEDKVLISCQYPKAEEVVSEELVASPEVDQPEAA